MGEILKASGADYSSVVKTTIMYVFVRQNQYLYEILNLRKQKRSYWFFCHRLADLNDFKKVNEIYAKCEFFFLLVFLLRSAQLLVVEWFKELGVKHFEPFSSVWCRLPSSFSSKIDLSSRRFAFKRQDRDRMYCNTLGRVFDSEHVKTNKEEGKQWFYQPILNVLFILLHCKKTAADYQAFNH